MKYKLKYCKAESTTKTGLISKYENMIDKIKSEKLKWDKIMTEKIKSLEERVDIETKNGFRLTKKVEEKEKEIKDLEECLEDTENELNDKTEYLDKLKEYGHC